MNQHASGAAQGLPKERDKAVIKQWLWLLPLCLLLPGSASQAVTEGPSSAERPVYGLRYLIFQHQDYWDDPALSGEALGDHRSEQEPLARQQRSSPSFPGAGRLNAFWQALRHSDQYRPLLHGLSRQTPQPRAAAAPLPVRGRWTASIRPRFAALSEPFALSLDWGLGHSGAKTIAAPSNGTTDRLTGTLTFYKDRHPHLRVALHLTEVRRWLPWGPDIRHYFLHRSRRLKTGRYHYFDHRRFGVLAWVVKAESAP